MMKHKGIYFLIITFFLVSCETEADRIQERLLPYVGEYEIDGSQTRGLITTYDAEGNPVGSGMDIVYFVDELIQVSILDGTDSLVIEGLITLHDLGAERREKVIGFLDGTEIKWDVDQTDQYGKKLYSGELIIIGDNIEVEYAWDLSSFNTLADPFYGMVEAKGIRK